GVQWPKDRNPMFFTPGTTPSRCRHSGPRIREWPRTARRCPPPPETTGGTVSLPDLATQHARLTDLGLEPPPLPDSLSGDLLVLHPRRMPASQLASRLRLGDREGFVVEDLDDLTEFISAPGVDLPEADLYAVTD